jgi:hypothetical protein
MIIYSKLGFTVSGLAALSFAPTAQADALADVEVVAMDKTMNSASTCRKSVSEGARRR